MSDKRELINLRISTARVAQTLGIDNELCVADVGYSGLFERASSIERGWNDLARRCAEQALELKQADARRTHDF